MAASRAAEFLRPEDSASNLGSTTSWTMMGDGSVPDVGQPAQAPKAPPPSLVQGSQAQGWTAGQPASTSSGTPPPADFSAWGEVDPPRAEPSAPPAQPAYADAPANQAARQVLGSAQQQGKRLAAQKAQAKRKGQKGIKWGQMSGANSQNFQLPPFIQQLGAQENERSVLVVDSRDKRIRSPFQGWLLDEILLNAQCGINVLSDGKLIRSPNSGYHMNVFYVRTLDGFKFILVGCMTSYGKVPCAKWDAPTGAVMAHPAFQPFRWPMMTNESATWVDVKFKVEGELLLHLELRGYRSDEDMTVQMNYLNNALIRNMNSTLFIPSMVVAIFQGWRVIATSFEVGGRLYACSDGGVVVAMDYPLCHFEVRITATSSADSIGLDAGRLEFRFRSAGDSVDVRCSQIVVPSTWLVVSRVSGPTLIKNARWCREHFARIEGPDQTMQLSQLAGIHAHWTAAVEAASIDETGPRIGEVAVNTHPANLHLTCESPLFRSELKIVPKTALALQAHDVEQEQSTAVLPPVTGGRRWCPWPRLRAVCATWLGLQAKRSL